MEFVSGGSKNHEYKTQNSKVHGVRLNSEGKTHVMHQNILGKIQQPQKEPCQTQVFKTHQIIRDTKNYDLYTFPNYKCYQLVYDKRVHWS